MAVNLSKNGTELTAAYKEVVNGKSGADWVLFTYEGNSNDIRLAGKGDGGLEEMAEELNNGKVMYAFCRVQDPNSGLPKYVLVNWTGEGVMSSRKAACANHLGSMANFLRGAHVTVNARSEDDVEPQTILDKVCTASAASFSTKRWNQEQRVEPRGPVGSVYRRVNAVQEIQQVNKEDFWIKDQMEEEARRREEKKRAELMREAMEKERREEDQRQAEEREKKAKERAALIERERAQQKQAEEEQRESEQQRQRADVAPLPKTNGSVYRKINAAAEIQKINRDDFWVKAQMEEEARRREEKKRAELKREAMEKERREEDQRQAEEREKKAKERAAFIERERVQQKRRAEEEEKQREQELRRLSQEENGGKRSGVRFAASVQKANEAKSLIAQRGFNPRDIFQQREQSAPPGGGAATSRPGKLQSPFLAKGSPRAEAPSSTPPWPLPTAVATATPDTPASPPLYRPHGMSVSTTSPTATDSKKQPEDDASTDHQQHQEEDDDWSDEFEEDLYEAPPANHDDLYDTPRLDGGGEELYENLHQDPAPVAENHASGERQGICARALYDYQAADDSEITFDPDDVITEIDMVDEGWWRGFGPDGHYGMFPANYVELL